MVACPGVSELFGETKVDDVHKGRVLACSDDEVGGFNVAMDKSAGVNVLDARDLRTEALVSKCGLWYKIGTIEPIGEKEEWKRRVGMTGGARAVAKFRRCMFCSRVIVCAPLGRATRQ